MISREEMYKAAIESHRHYDTLSLSIVGGAFGIAFGCLALTKDLPGAAGRAVVIAGAIAQILLLVMYFRTAFFATVARNVARQFEQPGADDPVVGVSWALATLTDKAEGGRFLPKRRFGWTAIRTTVTAMLAGLAALLLLVAFAK